MSEKKDKAIIDLARHIRNVLEDFSITPINLDDVHVVLPLDLYRQVEENAIKGMGPLIRDAKADRPSAPPHSFLLGGVRFVGRP